MAIDWPMLTLRESGVSVIDCDHQTPPAAEAGYPYVAIPQLKGGRLDLSGVRRISSTHFIEWTKKASPTENDVVLSRRCNPGETSFVPPNLQFALGQNLVLLRADGRVVWPPFLRWLTRSPLWWQEVTRFLNVGAVFDSLRCADIPKFQLPIPPLSAQRAIVRILGALDDKIELNRRMNETLEAMARALFQSWFVDFDPVRAKAEGRQPTGMDEDTRRLFPTTLIETSEGHMPEAWTSVRVEDIAETVAMGPFGSNIKVETFVNQGVPVISGKHLHALMVEDCGYNFVSIEHAERLRKCKVYRGDLIFTHAGTLGQVAYIPPHSQYSEYVISQRQFYLRCDRAKVPPVYMAYFFRSAEGQHRLLANVVSTGVPSISQPVTYLRTIKVLLPEKAVLDKFETIIVRWHAMIGRNNAASERLTAIRDTLLPKLLSGELRIPEAEAAVGKAL